MNTKLILEAACADRPFNAKEMVELHKLLALEPVAMRWRWPEYSWHYENYNPDATFAPRVEHQTLWGYK